MLVINSFPNLLLKTAVGIFKKDSLVVNPSLFNFSATAVSILKEAGGRNSKAFFSPPAVIIFPLL